MVTVTVPPARWTHLIYNDETEIVPLAFPGVLPWPAIPPPGSPPTLGSEEITPYRPPDRKMYKQYSISLIHHF